MECIWEQRGSALLRIVYYCCNSNGMSNGFWIAIASGNSSYDSKASWSMSGIESYATWKLKYMIRFLVHHISFEFGHSNLDFDTEQT